MSEDTSYPYYAPGHSYQSVSATSAPNSAEQDTQPYLTTADPTQPETSGYYGGDLSHAATVAQGLDFFNPAYNVDPRWDSNEFGRNTESDDFGLDWGRLEHSEYYIEAARKWYRDKKDSATATSSRRFGHPLPRLEEKRDRTRSRTKMAQTIRLYPVRKLNSDQIKHEHLNWFQLRDLIDYFENDPNAASLLTPSRQQHTAERFFAVVRKARPWLGNNEGGAEFVCDLLSSFVDDDILSSHTRPLFSDSDVSQLSPVDHPNWQGSSHSQS